MPDIPYAHARRLYESLLRFTDPETAVKIANVVPLTKTPSDKRRHQWAEAVCHSLANRFPEDQVAEIRMGCACGPGEAKLKALKRHFAEHGTLQSIADRLTSDGAPSWVEDGALMISYPRCFCSCVNKIQSPLPVMWCLCGVGYTRRNLEYALCAPVRVTLMESVKAGGHRCLMKVERMMPDGEPDLTEI